MKRGKSSSGVHPKIMVKVPATTANLGPGFDTLGMALDIHNVVTVEKSSGFGIEVSGEGADVISRDKDNKIYQGIAALYQKVGQPLPPLFLSCHNDIPLARGLGSSAAAIVAGLVAANALCGEPLSIEELLLLAAKLEGHPDNVAPALLGGCQIIVQEGYSLFHAPIPLPPGLKVVLFIPNFELSTSQSRSILSPQVSRADAVYNLGRVALLVAALSGGQLSYLRIATQDRLHQPARQALFPAMGRLLEAALEAGAWGAFLSGSGPTIVALATGEGQEIGEAMLTAAQNAGIGGKIRKTCPSFSGAQVIRDR